MSPQDTQTVTLHERKNFIETFPIDTLYEPHNVCCEDFY